MRDFHLPGRSPVYSSTAMAATSHPLATSVAIDLMRRGGTAVDAAVGAALVLGIAEPQMCGIGGDCFALIRPGNGAEVAGINGSGKAPSGFEADALRAAGHDSMPEGQAQSVTIPGAVDAFLLMLDRWGRLGRDAVLAPAIHAATEGVPVAPRVASDWASAADTLKGPARQAFLTQNRALSPGEVFRLPKQAETLKSIAQNGRAAFYEGAAAEAMARTLQAAGGSHTPEDFALNRPEIVTPITGQCAGATLMELPPNGQGATALLLAKILGHFDLAPLDPFGVERAHLEAEATKLAYDARNRFIGDPETSAQYLDHMLSDRVASDLAALIRPDRALTGPAALTEAVHKDTIYLTVVDPDGMSVSLIYSIFSSFGSGLYCPDTGVLFQNRGEGFTLTPGHPNEAGPGKRPMHTIIPGMLFAGEAVTPFGVMGGQYQSCGHVRFVTNMQTYGMDPQAAIDGPRCFAYDGELRLERGYSDAHRQALKDLGHNVTTPDTAIGGAQAITISPTGVLIAGSDPRKDGCAMGY